MTSRLISELLLDAEGDDLDLQRDARRRAASRRGSQSRVIAGIEVANELRLAHEVGERRALVTRRDRARAATARRRWPTDAIARMSSTTMPSGIASAALRNRSIVCARSRWYARFAGGRAGSSAENAACHGPLPSGTGASSGAADQSREALEVRRDETRGSRPRRSPARQAYPSGRTGLRQPAPLPAPRPATADPRAAPASRRRVPAVPRQRGAASR